MYWHYIYEVSLIVKHNPDINITMRKLVLNALTVLLCIIFILMIIFIFLSKPLRKNQGIEGEDEGAISMLSDNTAKLTSAVR